jgi:hypothetical protein
MNEIIENLLDWCLENNLVASIDISSSKGSIDLILRLRHGNMEINHMFYIPGGVLCKENWASGKCNLELEAFLNKAKSELVD